MEKQVWVIQRQARSVRGDDPRGPFNCLQVVSSYEQARDHIMREASMVETRPVLHLDKDCITATAHDTVAGTMVDWQAMMYCIEE